MAIKPHQYKLTLGAGTTYTTPGNSVTFPRRTRSLFIVNNGAAAVEVKMDENDTPTTIFANSAVYWSWRDLNVLSLAFDNIPSGNAIVVDIVAGF